ncbi:unnamed protein product [Cylicostephanus goldi]|uniref:Transthyretin/hydroxyisourate hydrolase domain-containing protein n=1 Tax=Cylicostephanus goldi TaxID=71465 RepID=A0A3P6RF43_CYLGO|nr:unnamed protein product [Cylicostephanus goldi]
MRLLWLTPLFLVSVDATYIGVAGELICPNPYDNIASIFLMERDFGRTIFDSIDDDDVLDYKEIELNKPFEIGGSETEIFGLEPYIYLRYRCLEDYKEEVINLGDTQFRDRVFHLRKNLISGKTILT